MTGNSPRSAARGFTLIELLVVMLIIGTLLSIAVPRYFRTLAHARETVLRQDLAILRESIDKYYADRVVLRDRSSVPAHAAGSRPGRTLSRTKASPASSLSGPCHRQSRLEPDSDSERSGDHGRGQQLSGRPHQT